MKFDRPHLQEDEIHQVAALFEPSPPSAFRDISGNPNQTFLINFASGRDLIIRVCNNGHTSAPHLLLEVDVLRHLESVRFPHAPRLVAGLDGQDIQTFGRYRVIAMDRVPGQPPTTRSITTRFCRQLGKAVAELANTLVGFAGRLPADESFHARADGLVPELNAVAQAAGWAVRLDWVVDAWRQADDALTSLDATQTLIHADIWPPNVLQAEDDFTALIDFDDMALGPAVIDLASALSEFTMFDPSLTINGQNALALLDGYLQSRPVSAQERAAVLPSLIALYAMWVAQDALHGVSYADTAVYIERLKLLVDPGHAEEFRQRLDRLFGRLHRS